MTSLAVFPLQRTMTDLTDDDLYQAPGAGTVFTSSAGAAYSSMSFTNPGVANAELSQILNVPDNFFENYSHRNGSNATLNGVSTPNPQESFESYDQNLADSPERACPFNSYAQSDSFNDMAQSQRLEHQQNQYQQPQHQNFQHQNQYQQYYSPQHQYQQYYQPPQQHQFHQQQQQQQSQQPAFVRPQLINMPSNLRNSVRKGRITTLDDQDPCVSGKPFKDDDYYLFNTDFQPSQIMATKNYFNPENMTNDSLYIMNSDLDPAVTGGDFSFARSGHDYVPMDEFVEDAEALSEDSDDDNCFQDEDGFEDDELAYHQVPTISPLSEVSSDNFMKIVPPHEQSSESSCVEDDYMHDIRKMSSIDSIDMAPDSSFPPSKNESMTTNSDVSRKSSLDHHMDKMHIHNHKTAAEISATNPEHQCELLNPSNGKPCNRKFSRPYDLIRHQETIHATEKKIYRCVICEGRANGGLGNGKSKTFSRNDALSRHIKVKHGLAGQEAIDLINEAKENVEYVMV